MEHDFSAYTVESLEDIIELLKLSKTTHSKLTRKISDDHIDIHTDLISMLSEAKTKSLAFRKGIEDKMDTLKMEANYK